MHFDCGSLPLGSAALQRPSDLLRQSSHRPREEREREAIPATASEELTSADDDQVVRVLGGGQPALGDPRTDDRASRRRPCQSLPISLGRSQRREIGQRKGPGGLTRDEETRDSISVQVYVTGEREMGSQGGAAQEANSSSRLAFCFSLSHGPLQECARRNTAVGP
jgi:hypothetical protein